MFKISISYLLIFSLPNLDIFLALCWFLIRAKSLFGTLIFMTWNIFYFWASLSNWFIGAPFFSAEKTLKLFYRSHFKFYKTDFYLLLYPVLIKHYDWGKKSFSGIKFVRTVIKACNNVTGYYYDVFETKFFVMGW